jgi:hypothetical protein
MVQLLGEPVNIFLPDCAVELYLIEPKVIFIFGLTALELHPLYMLSRFAAE